MGNLLKVAAFGKSCLSEAEGKLHIEYMFTVDLNILPPGGLALYLALFAACFLAATIIPFSSEAMFIAALKLSAEPGWLLVLVAGLGNTAGGMTGYYLGRLAKWEWLEKYFRLKHEKVLRYEHLAQRYGNWLALLCWLPLIGDLLCVVLGFFRAPLLWVLILMFLGKVGRYAVLICFLG